MGISVFPNLHADLAQLLPFVEPLESRSSIGERTFEWSQNDVFTVPHWTWASHEAIEADADLFVVSDRVVHEQLGLLREELQ